MKEKAERKERGSAYFTLALYAFGGLGIEGIYAYIIEPFLYGHTMQEFTMAESILHWVITCITWGIVAMLILKAAKKNLDFDWKRNDGQVSIPGILLCIVLIALITAMNWMDCGTLKIYHEYQKLGMPKFVFQHIYYLFETMLFSLIVVFGQIALEKWTKKKNIPFGGIVTGFTWGMVHWFTKGSILDGMFGILAGFLFGTIYLLLKRDLRKTYLVLALTFIL